MKTPSRRSRWWLALAAAVALALVAALALAWMLPFDHGVLTIDDQSFALSDLSGWQALPALAIAAAAIVLAGGIVGFVFLGLLLAGLAAVLGLLLAVAGGLLVMASPLLLIGAVFWWMLRSRPAAQPPSMPA